MTANALKYQELQEQKRSNKAKEGIAQQEANIKQQDVDKKLPTKDQKFYKSMDQFQTSLRDISNLFKIANDMSFYDKNGDSLKSLLHQSIDGYAGKPDVIDIDNVIDSTNSDLQGYNFQNTTIQSQKGAITVYEFIPYIGDSGTTDSACSMAVREFNTRVRGANSGATNYDAVDLFIFPLAVDSILTALAWIERGLSLVNYNNSRDLPLFTQDLLLHHCGDDPDVVRTFNERQADIIAVYNSVVDKLNALNIPYELDYIKRHVWLAGSVFKSGDSIDSQYIICNPEVFYTYDETATPGPILKAWSFKRVFMTSTGGDAYISSIRTTLMNMVSLLMDSQSIATMSGDILKAMPDKLLTLNKLPIDFATNSQLNVVTDLKYLQSFKNADIVPVDIRIAADGRLNTDLDIKQAVYQGQPYLYMGTFNTSTGEWTGLFVDAITVGTRDITNPDDTTTIEYRPALYDHLYDYLDTNEITDEDIVYNLSFSAIVGAYRVRGARSEILDGIHIWRYEGVTTNGVTRWVRNKVTDNRSNFYCLVTDSGNSEYTYLGGYVENLLGMNEVRYTPKFFTFMPYQDGQEINVGLLWNNNRNRNFMRSNHIEDINKQCIISMFMEPSHSGSTKRTKKPKFKK